MRKALKFLLVFILIISWTFSYPPTFWTFWKNLGGPPIPPEVQLANALNQVTNWNFNGNSTGWTYTSDTGTNVCGDDGTTGETSAETGAYDGTTGNPAGSFKYTTPATKNTNTRGKITQTFYAPGSETVKVKGRFDYYAVGSSWSTANTSWIRLDLYKTADSTFIANLACISFNTNQSWTTTSWSSDTNVTGGTQYTIEVTFRSRVGPSNASNSLWVDNIVVNSQPTGLTGSAVAGTTNVSLDWSDSSGGTGAPALYQYKIYRGGSYLDQSGTTSAYTDTSTAGNTNYSYTVSDVDVGKDGTGGNSDDMESPQTASVNVLTFPGAPGTPAFPSKTQTSITVSWTAPTGGSDQNYYVDRAPDVGGSPGTFTEVGTNVTSPWTNIDLTCETAYWYRVRGKNASGYGVYSGNSSETTSACVAAPTLTFSIEVPTDLQIGFGTWSGTEKRYPTDNEQGTTDIPGPNLPIKLSASTNAGSGLTITISSTGGEGSAGLYKSTTTPKLIPAKASTLVAATEEGYGVYAKNVSDLSIDEGFDHDGDTDVAIGITAKRIAYSDTAVSSGTVDIVPLAAISTLTPAGSYSDALTLICTGKF